MKQTKKIPVLVTTELKGVFFGYLTGHDPKQATATISNARNCVYWSADVKGFMGLAVTGPSAKCKVGPAVPKLTITKVSAIAETTDAAAQAWEAAPWSI